MKRESVARPTGSFLRGLERGWTLRLEEHFSRTRTTHMVQIRSQIYFRLRVQLVAAP
jgi:hypothetical protein